MLQNSTSCKHEYQFTEVGITPAARPLGKGGETFTPITKPTL